MTRFEKAEYMRRNNLIFDRWKAGETKAALAKEYGLSSERIRQICAKIDRIRRQKERARALRESRGIYVNW